MDRTIKEEKFKYYQLSYTMASYIISELNLKGKSLKYKPTTNFSGTWCTSFDFNNYHCFWRQHWHQFQASVVKNQYKQTDVDLSRGHKQQHMLTNGSSGNAKRLLP